MNIVEAALLIATVGPMFFAIYYMVKLYVNTTKRTYIDVETINAQGNTVVVVREVQ